MTSTATAPVVGSVVWRKVDPLASHQPVGGHVVGDYVSEDGEAGVEVVSFRKHHGLIQVDVHRIPLGDIAEGTKPPNCYTVAKGYRNLFAALGQRQTPAGPPLEPHELRWYGWAEALRRAGEEQVEQGEDIRLTSEPGEGA